MKLQPLRRALQVTLVGATAYLAAIAPSKADYPSVVLDDNPLGYWRFNESSGSLAVNSGTLGALADGSYGLGEKNTPGPDLLADGTVLKGLGPSSRAYAVGGVGSFVEVAESPLNGLQEFTITAWVRPSERSSNRIGLVGQHGAIELGFLEPNVLQLNTGQGGSVSYAFDPTSGPLQDFQWFYLAATGDGQSLDLFINGEHVSSGGSSTAGDDYGRSAETMNVGGGGIFDPSGNQFRGSLAEVAVWDHALPAERIAYHLTVAVGDGAPGDFDLDGVLDIDDVNLLSVEIFEESIDSFYDLDDSGYIDHDDLTVWTQVLKNTYLGDANLDGEFNSGDFVQVFQRGQYEDGIPLNSHWDDGDWNADLEFDTSDFVASFQDGGYEIKAIGAVASVPELDSLVALMLSAPWLLMRSHRIRHQRRPASSDRALRLSP